MKYFYFMSGRRGGRSLHNMFGSFDVDDLESLDDIFRDLKEEFLVRVGNDTVILYFNFWENKVNATGEEIQNLKKEIKSLRSTIERDMKDRWKYISDMRKPKK